MELESMVRYIRYSDREHVVDDATAELDTIVREARANKEVSMVYLRALERERELKEEGREEADEYYQPIIKQKDELLEQKDELLEQKDAENARLRALLAANGISET